MKRMKRMRLVVPAAMLAIAACARGGDEEAGGAYGEGAGAAYPADTAGLAPAPGTVDTTGLGTNPPTAGGQVIDTAAVPGPVDTTQGTPTAP